MNDANKYSLQMAESLDELATLICGFGYYANHNDDFEHPVPKEAVREYLEVGAMFQQLRVWHPKPKRPDNDSHILIVNDYGIGTAGVYDADLDFFSPTGMGRGRRWNDWNLDRWAYISDLVPKKDKENKTMTGHDETARFFDEEAVRKAFGHPDWPRGTEVVVYARKEDREKALMKMAQKGYTVTKFVEVSGLQAEIMGEDRFMAAKADALRLPTPWEAHLSTAGRALEDSMRSSVIYPSRELTEQMKRDYPKWLDQMLGGMRPSDWTSHDKPKE